MGQQDDAIIKACGLRDVVIEKISYSERELKIEIFARQLREKSFCHYCKSPILYVHEWKDRDIRGPPIGAFVEVIIHLKQLRGTCQMCDDFVRSAAVEFVHPQFQNFTLALCEVAGRMMEEITCEAVARLLRLNPKTMWDLDQWRMKAMKKRSLLPEAIDLSFMSADEVHFRTMPKKDSLTKPEIKFITNLVCYKEAKVLSNAMVRSSKSLEKCLSILTEPQRLSIHFFAVDMHDPFISVIRRQCTNAEICVDRFHVAQSVNDAFDEVRKSEFRKAKETNDKFQQEMLAPHRRFVLVEREKMLKQSDLKMLDRLKEINKNILNAMILVEHFHRILDKTEVEEFRKSLTLWYRLVRESALIPFRKLAKTIRRYRLNIESYIRSKLTTAVSEGLNNKIKTLKRMAYGYTNKTSFLNKILQRCGYLNSRYIDTTQWFCKLPEDLLAQTTPF